MLRAHPLSLPCNLRASGTLLVLRTFQTPQAHERRCYTTATATERLKDTPAAIASVLHQHIAFGARTWNIGIPGVKEKDTVLRKEEKTHVQGFVKPLCGKNTSVGLPLKRPPYISTSTSADLEALADDLEALRSDEFVRRRAPTHLPQAKPAPTSARSPRDDTGRVERVGCLPRITSPPTERRQGPTQGSIRPSPPPTAPARRRATPTPPRPLRTSALRAPRAARRGGNRAALAVEPTSGLRGQGGLAAAARGTLPRCAGAARRDARRWRWLRRRRTRRREEECGWRWRWRWRPRACARAGYLFVHDADRTCRAYRRACCGEARDAAAGARGALAGRACAHGAAVLLCAARGPRGRARDAVPHAPGWRWCWDSSRCRSMRSCGRLRIISGWTSRGRCIASCVRAEHRWRSRKWSSGNVKRIGGRRERRRRRTRGGASGARDGPSLRAVSCQTQRRTIS
ncbi:hypothetical protein H4582DRAFT_96945 [Lactarius indigo]|nr:hypothetical protein H4582DRAFT_96945 [Lactarius indigo]